jgi:hypothetical protein
MEQLRGLDLATLKNHIQDQELNQHKSRASNRRRGAGGLTLWQRI